MAVKLPETHLSQLLSWLEQYLPESFKFHEELRTHLRGQSPDLDFFVDRWPDPQAAVAIRREELEGTNANAKPLRLVEGVIGLKDEVVRNLLKDPSVLKWNTRVYLCVVSNRLKPVVASVAQEMGKSVAVTSFTLLKATPQDLKPIPVPDGMKLRTVSIADIGILQSTWKYAHEVPETFFEALVQHFPSVFLVTDDGQHVGHMIGTSYGTMGMLYVNPEFRRKGYAKVIVSQLAQKYFDRGEDAYVMIEEDNTPSHDLHQALGFRAVVEQNTVFSF